MDDIHNVYVDNMIMINPGYASVFKNTECRALTPSPLTTTTTKTLMKNSHSLEYVLLITTFQFINTGL